MATRKSTAKKPSLVEEYLQRIKCEAGGHDCIYRGQAYDDRRLESAAARRIRDAIGGNSKKAGEIPNGSLVNYYNDLLVDARQKGFGIRDGRELNDLEMLAELQHFGAATCLLDFTENPLVALYFACANEKEKQKNGKLFILRNANLSTVPENDSIGKIIESEKLMQWRPPMHGEAERRIIRQSGVFIINLNFKEEEEKKEKEKRLFEIKIVRGDKKKILDELRNNYQISAETLFIDLAGFANNRSVDKSLRTFWACFYRGNAKYDEQDFDGAIVDYNEAIRLKPDFANAYYNRGLARYEKGDLDDAIKDFDEAIRLNPDYANAYYNRGLARDEKGDLDDAIKDYTDTIRFKPDDAEAYNNRGVAKTRKGDWAGAIADYNEGIRLNPDFTVAYNNRGNAKRMLSKLDEAIKDYDEAIRLNPDYAEVYFNRGLAKFGKGDFDGAIEDYDESIRLNPDNLIAYFNRGFAKTGKGERDGAIKDYDEAIRLNPDYAEAYYYRAVVYSNRFSDNSKNEDLLQAQTNAEKALYLAVQQELSPDFIQRIESLLQDIEEQRRGS